MMILFATKRCYSLDNRKQNIRQFYRAQAAVNNCKPDVDLAAKPISTLGMNTS